MTVGSSERGAGSNWRVIRLSSFVDLHNSGLVSASITVVGSAKDCDNISVLAPTVSLHHQLMRSRHQAEIISVIKLCGNIFSKCVASSSRGNPETVLVCRVRPKQIAHGSFVWDLEKKKKEKEQIKKEKEKPKEKKNWNCSLNHDTKQQPSKKQKAKSKEEKKKNPIFSSITTQSTKTINK